PFRVHQAVLDAAQSARRYYYWKSEYLGELSGAAGDTLVSHSAHFPSPETSVLVMHLGGAVSRVGEDAMAAGHRDASYILDVAGSWLDPQLADTCISWTR